MFISRQKLKGRWCQGKHAVVAESRRYVNMQSQSVDFPLLIGFEKQECFLDSYLYTYVEHAQTNTETRKYVIKTGRYRVTDRIYQKLPGTTKMRRVLTYLVQYSSKHC